MIAFRIDWATPGCPVVCLHPTDVPKFLADIRVGHIYHVEELIPLEVSRSNTSYRGYMVRLIEYPAAVIPLAWFTPQEIP